MSSVAGCPCGVVLRFGRPSAVTSLRWTTCSLCNRSTKEANLSALLWPTGRSSAFTLAGAMGSRGSRLILGPAWCRLALSDAVLWKSDHSPAVTPPDFSDLRMNGVSRDAHAGAGGVLSLVSKSASWQRGSRVGNNEQWEGRQGEAPVGRCAVRLATFMRMHMLREAGLRRRRDGRRATRYPEPYILSPQSLSLQAPAAAIWCQYLPGTYR
jgi:hypothetical protein